MIGMNRMSSVETARVGVLISTVFFSRPDSAHVEMVCGKKLRKRTSLHEVLVVRASEIMDEENTTIARH